jgi:esterase FrsA
MHEWKKGLQEGDSWLEAFLQQCVENVDFLIDSGAIDPLRLAAGGLSRGAYIATHLASRCPAIQSLLGYAPLTRLAALDGPDNRPAALAQWDLERLVPQLLGRKVLFTIGNCDTRVGIGHCYEFIKLLADANFAAGTRSPPVELYIHPSIGHRGHGTPPEVFLKGVEWLTAACALP